MDISKIYNKIIPPDDWQSRNGFSNVAIIDGLTDEKKKEVEARLLLDLESRFDILIVETLVYLKCLKLIPFLMLKLAEVKSPEIRVQLSYYIFKLNGDEQMVAKAAESFRLVKNKYALLSIFYFLAAFKRENLNDIIREYTKHKDFLISYNAKNALKQPPDFLL